jgi:hypothetical protein
VDPLTLEGTGIGFNLTIGVVLADPGASLRAISAAADAALESARQEGLGSFRMVDLRAGRAA